MSDLLRVLLVDDEVLPDSSISAGLCKAGIDLHLEQRAEEQMRERGIKTLVAGFGGLPAGVKVPAAAE